MRLDAGETDEPGSRALSPFATWVLLEAGLAPLALVLGWALDQPPLAGFAWEEDAVWSGLAVAALMLIAMMAAFGKPIGPFRRIQKFLDRELLPVLAGCSAADLALMSVAAGVGEEMLFRGVVQGALTRQLGPGLGVAGAGLVFGLLHPVSPTYVALAALLGVSLGILQLVTGNLLAAIVAHAVYDFLALLVLLKSYRDRQDALEAG